MTYKIEVFNTETVVTESKCGAEKPQHALGFFHRPGVGHRCVNPAGHIESRHKCDCGEAWSVEEPQGSGPVGEPTGDNHG